MIEKIEGFEINLNENSKRIINIDISDEILNKLIFPFNKFDITALEYKPFTRFTIAKSLDDLSDNKLSKFLNKVNPEKKSNNAAKKEDLLNFLFLLEEDLDEKKSFLVDERKKIMVQKIKITQIRSRIGSQKNQIASLRGLGLWKVNSNSVLENTPETRGMIQKVNHLVRIESVD